MKSSNCLHCLIHERRNQEKIKKEGGNTTYDPDIFSQLNSPRFHVCTVTHGCVENQVETTQTSKYQNCTFLLLYTEDSFRFFLGTTVGSAVLCLAKEWITSPFQLCTEPTHLLPLFILVCVELLAAVQLAQHLS